MICPPLPPNLGDQLLVVPLSTPLVAALGLYVCFNLSICEHRNTASGGPATNCQICRENELWVVSPVSYWSSSPPLRVTVRVLKDFISTDRHFLIFQDANHLSFWWLALRNVMTLLIGNSRVAVLCVCVCVFFFCSTRAKKWCVLCLTCRTTVEVFLLQNRRDCISFFCPRF